MAQMLFQGQVVSISPPHGPAGFGFAPVIDVMLHFNGQTRHISIRADRDEALRRLAKELVDAGRALDMFLDDQIADAASA